MAPCRSLPAELELALRTLHLIRRDRRVGHPDLGAAALSARFAALWSGKTSTFTPDLPAALQALPCLVASSAWVVPFSTATVVPQRSASVAGLTELPAFVKNDVPALK